MLFNETFTDPNRKIHYPSTWGGKTALEKFEDLKQELWYQVLAVVVQALVGLVWLLLVYAYWQLLQELARYIFCHVGSDASMTTTQKSSSTDSTWSRNGQPGGYLSGPFSP